MWIKLLDQASFVQYHPPARWTHAVPCCCFSVWFGVIFIRHGLYQDGVFKFTVYIPDNYPDGECPVSSMPPHLIIIRSHPDNTLWVRPDDQGEGFASWPTGTGFNPKSPKLNCRDGKTHVSYLRLYDVVLNFILPDLLHGERLPSHQRDDFLIALQLTQTNRDCCCSSRRVIML